MKKARGRKKWKMKARKGRRQLNMVATIVISGQKLIEPLTLITSANGPVVWVIDNQDNDDYRVLIDFAEITPDSPFDPTHPSVSANVAALQQVLLGTEAATNGKKNQRYDYTVRLFDSTGTTEIDALDPDLDVIDPGAKRY